MKSKIKYTKDILLGVSVVVLALFTACSPNENGYRNESKVDSSLFPVASFSASATTILKGESVTFNSTSTNEAFLYSWSFPGGNPTSSNEANPTVTYEGSGMYTVTLKARNNHGANEVTIENYVEVTAPPVIDIDTKAQLRYTFEDNLDSDLDKGLQNITASSAGAAIYDTRPGGGGAYVCDGTNPLTIPGYTGINGAGARSAALWIKTTHAATSGLVHWGASGSFSRSSFKMQNSGVIRFEYQGGGHNGSTTVNDGAWHHVAYTYDGSTIKLYVDGVEDFTVSGKTLRTGEAGETDVNIGSQGTGAKWQGTMDDVRVFDTVLTPAEVLVLSQMN